MESLKIPPQDEDAELEDPSILHLIQLPKGGDQKTYIISGGFGGLTMISNFFNMMRLLTDEFECLRVLFPKRVTA